MKKVLSLKSSIILFVLLLLTLLTFSGWCQNKPIELSFGHIDPPNNWTSQEVSIPWAEKLEKVTNGRVKVTIYPAESLFKAKDLIPSVEAGIGDITNAPLGYFPGMFPLTEVIYMPFLTKHPNAELTTRVINELFETTPEIQEEFSRVKVLYFACHDPYYIATVKKPVHNLEDMKGLKIRVAGLYATKIIEKLGATPVSMPLPDLYDALQKGVVDGALVMWDMISSFSVHQVLPYWTKVPFWTSTVVQIMNKEKWESLPSDIQEQIMSFNGLEGGLFYANRMFGPDAWENAEKLMKKDGKSITWFTLPDDEIERWTEIAGPPIWDMWVAEMDGKGKPGRKILDRTIEIFKKYE